MGLKFEKVSLILLLIISFIVRLIPHRNLILATYDEYLHKDITLRIVNKGFGVISKDIYSLLGLKAYSYPPMFHIIGALCYKLFPSDYIFFVLPAIIGTLTVFVYYYFAREVVNNEKVALLSTLFFAFAPNFIYRSSLYIPENLGLLLFTLSMFIFVRFLKSRNWKYLGLLIILLPLYMITHRGWVMFILAGFFILLPYIYEYTKKYTKYMLILVGVFLLGILTLFFVDGGMISDAISRIPKTEVSLLGYFKWIGVIQLIFGFLALNMYLKGNNLKKGIALWALAFLAIGSFSFRFRDPYATFPMAIMASEYIYLNLPRWVEKIKSELNTLKLKLKINKRKISVILISSFILLSTIQGGFGAYIFIEPPTVKDKEAFEWIKKNTPENSVFLTWWTTGYMLIGNTHRRDILTWMKVYQGFMGKPPSLRDVLMAYSDLVAMFGEVNKERTYYLFKKYNVSYIYLDKTIRNYGIIKHGLSEYVTYDTHFKLLFANGNSEIYKYIPNATLEPKNKDKIKYNDSLINYLEKFWTSYNYADFDEGYKADFVLNAKICKIYDMYYKETNYSEFKDRKDYLLKWLAYKEMENGAYVEGIPPDEDILTTVRVIEPIINMNFENKDKAISYIKKEVSEIDYNITTSKEKNVVKVASLIPYLYKLNLINDSQLNDYIDYVLKEQKSDGKWGRSISDTIQVAYSLGVYYKLSNDTRVLEAINKSAKYIINYEEDNGYLKDEYKYKYSKATYAKIMFIYHILGLKEKEKEEKKIVNQYNSLDEIKPLEALLDIYEVYSYMYDEKMALNKIKELIKDDYLSMKG